ncbi:MAG: YceI family protein [Bacteriovoracaceae bacterium]
MKYILFFLFFSLNLNASSFVLLKKHSSVSVHGTSTLHDWTMKGPIENGAADLEIDKDQLKKMSSLSLSIRSEDLKSDSDGLNENAYEALQTKKYPIISFKLKSLKKIIAKEVVIEGDLTVSGVTKTIEVKGKILNIGKDFMRVDGQHTLKMSEVGIEPPSVMLGMISSGDEIKISFNVLFKEKK